MGPSIWKFRCFFGHSLSMLGLAPVDLYKAMQKIGEYHQHNFPEEHSCLMWFSPIHPVIFVYGCGDVEQVLRAKRFNQKHFFYKFLQPWLGEGLLTSNKEKWQKRRRMLTPAFHFTILKQFAEIMNKNAKTMVRLLHADLQRAGTKSITLDIFPRITLSALDIICEAAMGKSIDAQHYSDTLYIKAIDRSGKTMVQRMENFYQWPTWLFHLKAGNQYHKDIALMKDFTTGV